MANSLDHGGYSVPYRINLTRHCLGVAIVLCIFISFSDAKRLRELQSDGPAASNTAPVG